MAGTPVRPASVDEFALALHACLGVRDVQETFIRCAERLLPARAHGIYELDGGTPGEVRTRGVSDEFLAEYEAAGRGLDPVLARIERSREPVSSDLAWTPAAWREEPFYAILGHGDIHHLVQAPLVAEGRLVGTLNVASPLGAPPFGRAEVARLRRVARHISVAYLFANRAADRLLAVHLDARRAALLRSALRRNGEALADGSRRVANATVQVGEPAQGEWRPLPVRPQGRCTTLAVRTAAMPRAPELLASFVYEAPTDLPAPLPVLSPREQEVVELLVRGLSNRAIAEAAAISENTVKQHLKRVYAKLGVHSRAEAAAAAARAAADDDGPFAKER